MSVPKKWSRRIVVDAVACVWRFRHRPNRSQDDGFSGVAVTVHREDCPWTSLYLVFPQRFHPSAQLHDLPPRPVLPSDVAAGTRAALAAGWIADMAGRQFVLKAP